MAKNIDEIEFTIFDLETTGLDPRSGERIVEIAALRVRDKQIFNSLVNPGNREISSGAFAVNHISREMLKSAPAAGEILPKFLDFVSGSCLTAYNAPFDIAFLCSELGLIDKQLPQGLQIADILTMAKRMLPHLKSYALWFVAKSLGINTIQEHRALSDVRMTAEVFNHLNSLFIEGGIVDFEQFISLFGLGSSLLDNINNTKIARIQEALDLRASLRIKYFSRNKGEFSEREVIPQAIIQKKSQAYLVAYCNLRNQERTFKIKNILHLEIGALTRRD